MNEEKYLEKDLLDLPKGYEDARGIIQPLCDLNMKSASLIVSKANTWRANHYHKNDWHFIYVLKGSFEYYFKKTNSDEKIKKKIVKKGELLFTGPVVDHAMFYTEETEIIVLSKNPRDQKTYEEDTVRIDFMNNENRF
jgi:dTDP-4-dehydrorhamnose 3,5-epimerase-like enzyme|tara:strand:- start:99 stop:512 length:414 start_codon:yes stop_codon:yes gene_type:complete